MDKIKNSTKLILIAGCIVGVAILLRLTALNVPVPVSEDELVELVWAHMDHDDPSLGRLDRAALYMPVKVDEQEYYMQLDTGASLTVLNKHQLDHLELPYKHTEPLERKLPGKVWLGHLDKVTIGSLTLTDELVQIWEQPLSPVDYQIEADFPLDRSIGTLGWNTLKNGYLYLDYRRQKGGLFDRKPAVSSSASLRFHQHPDAPYFIILPVTFPTGQRLEMVFDTGVSAFPLVVTESLFVEITGLAGADEAPYSFTAPSWGEEIVLQGAPLNQEMRLSKVSLPIETIWTAPIVDEIEKHRGLQGIIGNAAFFDQAILIDYQRRKFIFVNELLNPDS